MKAIFSREAKKFFDFARWVVYSLHDHHERAPVFSPSSWHKASAVSHGQSVEIDTGSLVVAILQLKNVSGVHCGKFYPNLYRLGCTVLKVFQPWAVASSFLRSSQFSECQPLNQLILEGRFSLTRIGIHDTRRHTTFQTRKRKKKVARMTKHFSGETGSFTQLATVTPTRTTRDTKIMGVIAVLLKG